MTTLSIRELHTHTGKWIREASVSREPIIVLDRGRPTARLVPYASDDARSFAMRRNVEGFDQLPEITADSGALLENDRK